jgi:hypothetical protein
MMTDRVMRRTHGGAFLGSTVDFDIRFVVSANPDLSFVIYVPRPFHITMSSPERQSANPISSDNMSLGLSGRKRLKMQLRRSVSHELL